MIAHILQKIKNDIGLSSNLQNRLPSDASFEIHQAHIFEDNIDDPERTDSSSLAVKNYNARNAMWNYLRAALRGDKNAQYKIGLSYLNGQLGLDRNYQHAEKWLSQAARQGHSEALQALEKALNHLTIS